MDRAMQCPIPAHMYCARPIVAGSRYAMSEMSIAHGALCKVPYQHQARAIAMSGFDPYSPMRRFRACPVLALQMVPRVPSTLLVLCNCYAGSGSDIGLCCQAVGQLNATSNSPLFSSHALDLEAGSISLWNFGLEMRYQGTESSYAANRSAYSRHHRRRWLDRCSLSPRPTQVLCEV
eukprot:2204283-Rhodomonas_salina.2